MDHPIFLYSGLCLAAMAAGAVNAIAGGGTLLTFPALQILGGISPVMANGTSTVAVMGVISAARPRPKTVSGGSTAGR